MMKAGEVKGRNENINKLRNDQIGDGMPTGLGTKTKETRKPARSNSILDLASQA